MTVRDFSGVHAAMTCSTRLRPPARCRTFAKLDLSRVPFPAARMTTARSLAAIGQSFCGSRINFAMRRLLGFQENAQLAAETGARVAIGALDGSSRDAGGGRVQRAGTA